MDNQIIIYIGDSLDQSVTITDCDGDAFDLTGYKMYMSIKEEYDSTAFTIGPKEATIDAPTSGIGVISLENSDTEDLVNRTYVYDIVIRKTEDSVITDEKTVISDKFIVKNKVNN